MHPNSLPLWDTSNKRVGLLVPVWALRRAGDLGIGDTLAVKGAIDFCVAQSFSVLQILPIHECIGDYSPYNSISSQALSPALLAMENEEVPGLSGINIAVEAPESWLVQLRQSNVKYNSVQPLKNQLLLQAHQIFRAQPGLLWNEFTEFQKQRTHWLPAYTLFRLLIREYEGNTTWTEWRPEHQSFISAEAWLARHPDRQELEELREGYAYIQWVGYRQWRSVRKYAEAAGVWLMGEASFGVSRCSVDVWQHPELFDLEWNVGSQPITYFDTNKDSEKWGQNWGLPAYRWENHRSTGFAWLRDRFIGEKQFFHICRLDHLRGYFRAYMFPWPGGPRHAEYAQLGEEEILHRTGGKLPRFVPARDDDPVGVRMNDLQGREIISVIREASGEMYLIAEIMGIVPDYLRQALDDLGMPNLTFPQLERNPDQSLRPLESFRVLSLVTYANHDHAPLASYYKHLWTLARDKPDGVSPKSLQGLLAFVGWTDPIPETLTEELWKRLLQKLFQSPCQLAVLLSSDLLATTQRFNLPGSYGLETWSVRLEFDLQDYTRHPLYSEKIATVRNLIKDSGRANESTG